MKKLIVLALTVIIAFLLIVFVSDAVGEAFGNSMKIVVEVLIALILLGLLILNYRKGK